MYKVFIQNKPLIFANSSEFDNFNGILIKESIAFSDRNLVNNLLKNSSINNPVFVLCENPEKSFQLYFDDYEKIEAAGGIVKRKNKYLFIKRNGVWDIPKGKLEINETPELGGIREIEEECGIKNPRIDYLITITYHTYEFKGLPTLKKTYWYAMQYDGPKEVKPQMEEGISKVSWKKETKISKILTNTYASIEDVIRQFVVKNNITIEI
jgi:ADP-ribose pyrophosphatase YjhB (NUDIX family)